MILGETPSHFHEILYPEHDLPRMVDPFIICGQNHPQKNVVRILLQAIHKSMILAKTSLAVPEIGQPEHDIGKLGGSKLKFQTCYEIPAFNDIECPDGSI